MHDVNGTNCDSGYSCCACVGRDGGRVGTDNNRINMIVLTDNPTGKDIIIRAILDNSDGCLCECATVFHLHENASNQQV